MQEVYNLFERSRNACYCIAHLLSRHIRSAKMCNRQILFCGISERTEEFEKMILSYANMYEGALFSFKGDFLDYLGLENMGVFTSMGLKTRARKREKN